MRIDFPAIVSRKDAIVRRWQDGVRKSISGAGERLQLVEGHARFVSANEIEVGSQRYRAGVIVIDVGVRPAVPEVEGLAGLPWLDNRRVMELSAVEFIRRFLLHVVPSGFVRIRHYGLMGNRVRAENLARCRALLGVGQGSGGSGAAPANSAW